MKNIEHLAKVYAASCSGLDIITSVCPQAAGAVENTKKKFRLRLDEKTPSACLVPPKGVDGCWYVVDYGGGEGERRFSPIDLYMREKGYTQSQFSLALHKLMEQYGVAEELKSSVNKPDIEQRDAMAFEIGQPPKVVCREGFSNDDLATWGPCVKGEHLKELGWKSVVSISVTKDSRTTIRKSTDTYPIFVEDCAYQDADGIIRKFQKVYEPKCFNKAFRFFIIGKKPQHYIFGLDALRRKFEERGEEKLDEVVLVSGGSDAVNCLSMGYQPVWLGSETEDLTESDVRLLLKYARRIVSIPDIDATGRKAGRRLALRFPIISTAWMTDDDMGHLHDNRQRRRKDLKDFIQLHPRHDDMYRLISRAQSALYWSKQEDKEGHTSYVISPARLNYYLGLHGYYTLKDDTRKEPLYILVDGIKVNRVVAKTIVNFLLQQTVREGLDEALQNKLLRCRDLPTNQTSHLAERDDLDFTKSTATSQRFFFRNGWVEVTADGITRKPYTSLCDSYVWQESIVEHDYRDMAPMFEVTKDDDGDLLVKVADCQPSKFFQFVINASRLYWRKADEQGLSLTDEELAKENRCLLSKLLNIGYLLWGYKSESQAWATLCLDSAMGESEDECNGRSGKSFFLKALGQLLNTFCIEARVPSIVDNRFLFDGVTADTDLIIVDECHRQLNFDFFFGRITGNFRGEAKGDHPFEIPFSKSPKFAFGTNYTLRKNDPSTMGRVWPQIFSDYYHEKTRQNDYLETRKIRDDFGCDLMGIEYPEQDWQADIAFMLQCVRLYLSLPVAERKVMPPMECIERRSERAVIGRDFEEWAEVYFAPESGNLDREVKQDELYNNFCREVTYKISKTKLTKKLKTYCEYAHHIHCLNPASVTGKQKDGERIMRRVDGVMSQFFYVQSVMEYERLQQEVQTKSQDSTEQDLPF